jgi:hypothetical protein
MTRTWPLVDRGGFHSHDVVGLLLHVLDNLYKFVVPAVAGPARLVPLPALATEQLSANAPRVAAIRGRLKAAKAADGTWRSSKAWVDEYRATRSDARDEDARGHPLCFRRLACRIDRLRID